LLQYKTVLQSSFNSEQVRQSFQCFLGQLLVPTLLYQAKSNICPDLVRGLESYQSAGD